MLRVTKRKSELKKQRFVGICADAETLGVSREHLFRVLVGERLSRRLLQRYRALKRAQSMKASSMFALAERNQTNRMGLIKRDTNGDNRCEHLRESD